MTQSMIHESYNVNLIIVDHFDEIILKIDIKTEELIGLEMAESPMYEYEGKGASEVSKRIYANDFEEIVPSSKYDYLQRDLNLLNEQRRILIDKIIEIRQYNLNINKDNQAKFYEKWQQTILDNQMSHGTKMDLFKMDILRADCFLREYDLGFSLWITNWHVREQDKHFFSYFDLNNNFKINTDKHNSARIECIDKHSINNFCILNELKSKPLLLVHDLRYLNQNAIQDLNFDIESYLSKSVEKNLERRTRFKFIVGTIKSDTFHEFTSLESLKLNFSEILCLNTITSLITDLSKLKILDLSGNKLTQISSELFFGITNLETIILSNNQLNSIDSKTFCGANNLRVLHLGHNSLSINSDCFLYLKNLKELYLNSSLKQGALKLGLFKHLNCLEILNLEENSLVSLESHTFTSLNKLKELYLNNNCLSKLDSNVFIHLKSLTKLNLSANGLKKIDKACFNGLYDLKILDLSRNSITAVDTAVFDSLNNLEYLNFYRSGLKEAEIAMLTNLNNLKRLNLYDRECNFLVL
jgi:Leucine-rich repeat (LRR) protein